MNKTHIATMGERFFMSKIAIATDSNSGITQAQGRELGIFVMPMPFYINDELFLEDITLSQEQFYQRLEEGADVKTTQPAPGDVLELWERILKDYDELVYIPMSSGLSSSCETAVMLAQDYSGRVQVVNNQRISVTLRQSALDAQALARGRARFADPAWVYGDSRPLAVSREARFTWGLLRLDYSQAEGSITQAALWSDGLEADFLSQVPGALQGCPRQPAAVRARLMALKGAERTLVEDILTLLMEEA